MTLQYNLVPLYRARMGVFPSALSVTRAQHEEEGSEELHKYLHLVLELSQVHKQWAARLVSESQYPSCAS